MKCYYLLFWMSCFSCAAALAQNENAGRPFALNGHLTGRDSGIIVLTYMDVNGKNVQDTQHLSTGAFGFNGVINGPTLARLIGKIKSRSLDDPNCTFVFLEPAYMGISLTEGDFHHAITQGSRSQDEWDSFLREEMPIHLTLLEFSKERRDLQRKKDKDSSSGKTLVDSLRVIQDKIAQYREQLKSMELAFIRSHPSSSVSPLLLVPYANDKELSLDSIRLFYSVFSTPVKNSYLGRAILTQIHGQEQVSQGKAAPLFTLEDIHGKTVRLDAFKGKNDVLLDFCASWCEPCRQLTPHLKELYQKYHDQGLVIIVVSIDDDPNAWVKMVRTDKIDAFLNVRSGSGATPNTKTNIRQQYNVGGIPSDFLIGKDGIIIGRYSGVEEDGDQPSLDKAVKELFWHT
jgi:peroxiredoxin